MKKSILFLSLTAAFSLGACTESTDNSTISTEGESVPENVMETENIKATDVGTTATGVGTTGTSGTPTTGTGDTTGTKNRQDSLR